MAWRVTRLECVGVLRTVCDLVLGDPEASETVLYDRAKVLFLAYLTQGLPLIQDPMITPRVCGCSALYSRARNQISLTPSKECLNDWLPKPPLEDPNTGGRGHNVEDWNEALSRLGFCTSPVPKIDSCLRIGPVRIVVSYIRSVSFRTSG